MEFKDYYKVLGVSPKSSSKEIKETYRRLARKYHPDVNPGDAGAEERFKEINEAYEALRDDKKRARYDQVRAAHQSGRSWQTHARTGAGGGFPFDIGGLGGFDFDGLGRGKESSGGFSDFFETIFGRMQQAGEQQGKDLEQEIEVTLAEAYAGTNRSFNLQVPGQCPACAGSGRIENMVCTVCRGSGTQMRQRRLDVKIPAGVREGSRIRVAGEGHPGKNGERGNLYLIVKIAPDSHFELKADDLYVDVPVELVDAVLGRGSPGTDAGWQERHDAHPRRNAKRTGLQAHRPRHAETQGPRAGRIVRACASAPAERDLHLVKRSSSQN